MTDLWLLLLSPFLFGFLVGVVTGMSRAPGSGITLVGGVLGTGLVAQLITGLLLSLDINSVLIVLGAFAAGGLVGVFIGIALRRRGIHVEAGQK